MLRVTKLTDYATLVLTTLAQAPARVLSANELAELAHLELPTVSKVLKPLAHAGLVESFRGSNGGYKLARDPASISVIEIVEAIEGRVGVTECSGDHSHCEIESHCSVRGKWRDINSVVANALRGVTLSEMLPRPRSRKAIPLQLATG